MNADTSDRNIVDGFPMIAVDIKRNVHSLGNSNQPDQTQSTVAGAKRRDGYVHEFTVGFGFTPSLVLNQYVRAACEGYNLSHP